MLHQKKALLISALAVSLVACSTGTENANTPTDSASSPPSSVVSSSNPQTTGSSANVTIPGVDNVGEISFKPFSQNSPSGFFDGINGSGAPTVQARKGDIATVSGWAVLPNGSELPDQVIITYGDSNSLLAVAPVNSERPDVAKFFKKPNFKNSGWKATFDTSSLPSSPIVLKAWAFDADRKEATQLNNTRQLILRS